MLAKRMYNIVENREFVDDMKRLEGGAHESDTVGSLDRQNSL